MLHVLLFLTTYCGGILYALLASPVVIFVVYEAVYFFNPDKRWWGHMVPELSYSFFVVLIMAGLFVFKYGQYKHNRLLQVPQFKWMYLVLTLYGMAYFYAVIPDAHYDSLIFYAKLILIISLAYKLCDDDKKLDYLLYGYIFGAWYISFIAFQTGRTSTGRVEGIGTVDSPDANGLAAAIAPSLLLCLYYFWTAKDIKIKVLVLVAAAFIANAIVLINSRASFLALVCASGYFMVYMYFSGFQRKHQKLTAVAITLFALAGVLYVTDAVFWQRMATIVESTVVKHEVETGSTRVIFWQSAWQMVQDHPFGAGFRGFNMFAPFYIPEGVHTGESLNRSVHSTWFEALTEIGYLGFLCFVMMIYACFKSCRLAKQKLKSTQQVDQYFKLIALEAALITFIIAMSFMNRMRAEILYWCILYTGIAYNIYVLKPRQVAQQERAGTPLTPVLTEPAERSSADTKSEQGSSVATRQAGERR